MYDKIMKDQAVISYVLHIPFLDTNDMCPYDRELLLDAIKEIKDQENSE